MALHEDLPRALDVQRFAEARQAEVANLTGHKDLDMLAVGFHVLFLQQAQDQEHHACHSL